jgi:hypothetical protein
VDMTRNDLFDGNVDLLRRCITILKIEKESEPEANPETQLD